MNDKCPCINCVCAAICRHKLYGYLFKDCILLRTYMPLHDVIHLRDAEKVDIIVKVLHPTHWEYIMDATLNTKFRLVSFKGEKKTIEVQLRRGDKA